MGKKTRIDTAALETFLVTRLPTTTDELVGQAQDHGLEFVTRPLVETTLQKLRRRGVVLFINADDMPVWQKAKGPAHA